MEAEQLLALRQQIKGLNTEKQSALDQAFRELADWKQRAQQAEATVQAQQAEVDGAREGSAAHSSKITVLERQLTTTDRRVRDLDKLLHAREKEVRCAAHAAVYRPGFSLAVRVIGRRCGGFSQLRRAREVSQGVSTWERQLEERIRRQQADNKRLMKLLARTVGAGCLSNERGHVDVYAGCTCRLSIGR